MIIINALLKQPIYSINLAGKVKYGLKDFGDKVDKKSTDNANKIKDKLRRVKNWATDDMSIQDAQEYFDKVKMPVKVGAIKKVNSADGAIFKVLAGNYKDKNYYGFYLYRNGNDIRVLNQDVFGSNGGDNVKDAQNEILQWYNNVDTDWESGEEWNPEEEPQHPDEYNEEEYEKEFNPESNVYDENGAIRMGDETQSEEDDLNVREGDIVLDKGDVEIYDDGDSYIIREADDSDDSSPEVDYGEWNY